jgi:hypothetical protein
VTHQHWITCEGAGRFAVVTALRNDRDPALENVHTSVLAITDAGLAVVSTDDQAGPDGSFPLPGDMCGSPINTPPAIAP